MEAIGKGDIIQKQILRKSVESPMFSKEVLPKTPLEVFGDNNMYKEISNIIKVYYKTNGNVISEDTLLTLTEEKLDRMGKDGSEQSKYYDIIHEIYDVRDNEDNSVIDEKIESHIKKHLRMNLMKKAAVNLEDERIMEDMEKELRDISMLDVSGKEKEIINVLDDTEIKKRALMTINQNTIRTGFGKIDKMSGGGLAKGEVGLIAAPSGLIIKLT